MRVLVGGLIAGIILSLGAGSHSLLACLVAGLLLTFLLLQLGPRSVVEKIGAVMTVALLALVAGPSAGFGHPLLFLIRWAAAGTALAFYLRPKAE